MKKVRESSHVKTINVIWQFLRNEINHQHMSLIFQKITASAFDIAFRFIVVEQSLTVHLSLQNVGGHVFRAYLVGTNKMVIHYTCLRTNPCYRIREVYNHHRHKLSFESHLPCFSRVNWSNLLFSQSSGIYHTVKRVIVDCNLIGMHANHTRSNDRQTHDASLHLELGPC